jgi:hypothetical protein
MRRIAEHATGLQWSRPSIFRREFELRSGEELLATLRIRGAFRPVGIAESGDGSWTFERAGFLQRRATIRAGGAGTDVAEFRSGGLGSRGELTFATGSKFTVGVNFWRTRLEVRSDSGEPLLTLHRRGWCGRTADVEIHSAARHLAELPLLVTFGWFHYVMLEQDAGAVVVTG